MKVLTPEECPKWLKDAGIRHDPCRGVGEASHHYMTGGLTDARRSIAFARSLLRAVEPKGDHLLEITDWSTYQEDEMAVEQSVRASFGETRWLIKSPGHMFLAADLNLCVGCSRSPLRMVGVPTSTFLSRVSRYLIGKAIWLSSGRTRRRRWK